MANLALERRTAEDASGSSRPQPDHQVLYVLEKPSIGLHLSDIVGLTGVMRDLVTDNNSVLLVDHETQTLSQAD